MKEKMKLIKSAGVVGGLTLISRIFGYFRDAALAVVLGAGFSMDAFTVAYRLANLFRRFFAEGTMTAAFVPVFTEWREHHSREDMWDFVRKFFYSMAVILLVITALQILFSPFVVDVMAPGFLANHQKWELTVFLNRLMAPFLIFIGLAAIIMAVLNAENVFAVPAATPIFFNIAIIISAFTMAKWFHDPSVGIAIGVIIGGAAQFVVQIPFAKIRGMSFVPVFSFRHPAIQRVSKLMATSIFAVGIVQINLLIDSLMASFLPEGSVSSLYYANRVTELTLGTFITSLATVILPQMSQQAAKNDRQEMTKTLSFSLRIVSSVTIPASIGLLILANPIIKLLFQHGRFGPIDTDRAAFALIFYSVGLFFVAGARIVVPSFYAVQDPKTPVRCAGVSLAVNIIMNLILMFPLKQGGLALATSIAAAVNFFQLLWNYKKKIGAIDWNPFFESLKKVAVSTLFLAISCITCIHWLKFDEQIRVGPQAISLFATIVISLAVYGLAMFLLRSEEWSVFKRMLKSRAVRGKS